MVVINTKDWAALEVYLSPEASWKLVKSMGNDCTPPIPPTSREAQLQASALERVLIISILQVQVCVLHGTLKSAFGPRLPR